MVIGEQVQFKEHCYDELLASLQILSPYTLRNLPLPVERVQTFHSVSRVPHHPAAKCLKKSVLKIIHIKDINCAIRIFASHSYTFRNFFSLSEHHCSQVPNNFKGVTLGIIILKPTLVNNLKNSNKNQVWLGQLFKDRSIILYTPGFKLNHLKQDLDFHFDINTNSSTGQIQGI